MAVLERLKPQSTIPLIVSMDGGSRARVVLSAGQAAPACLYVLTTLNAGAEDRLSVI